MKTYLKAILVQFLISSTQNKSNDDSIEYIEAVGFLGYKLYRFMNDNIQYWHHRLANPYSFNEENYYKDKAIAEIEEKKQMKALFGENFKDWDDHIEDTNLIRNSEQSKEGNFQVTNQFIHRERGLSEKNSDRSRLLESDFDHQPDKFKEFFKTSYYSNEDMRNREIIQIHDEIVKGESESIGPFSECINGGVPDSMTVKVYICNEKIINKLEFYYKKEADKSCFEKTIEIKACSCPYDFSGIACEVFVGVSCKNFKAPNEDQDCLEKTKPSNPNRIHIPNCRKFDKNKIHKFEFSFDCHLGEKNKNQVYEIKDLKINTDVLIDELEYIKNFNREGVKIFALKEHSDNIELVKRTSLQEQPKFEYFQDLGNTVKLTNSLSISFRAEFVDFDDLLNEYTFSDKISKDQLKEKGALSNFSFSKDIEYDKVRSFGSFGRIPLTLKVMYNDTYVLNVQKIPKQMYQNDHEYVLPPPPINYYWAFAQQLLISIQIIGIIYCIKDCFTQYKKELKNFNKKLE